MSRYARRVDQNQSSLVDTFRVLGCEVKVTSHLGDGFPDLVIKRGGQVRFVEVKDGSKPPSARALTKAEQGFQALLGDQYRVVETAEQAHQLVADMMLREALRN